MTLTLYGIPVSSYVAKVRLALRLKGLDFTEVPPPGGYGSPAYRAIVSAGSVPAIVHDGFVLHESEAILEYLEEAFPTPALHPADRQTRAWHRAIALYHDTKLEPTVRAMFPFIAKQPDDAQREALRVAYADKIEQLAELVSPAPFLGGKTIALGECGFPTTIMMGNCLLGAMGSEIPKNAKIAGWMAAFDAHPVAAENTAICRAALDSWVAEKLASRSA